VATWRVKIRPPRAISPYYIDFAEMLDNLDGVLQTVLSALCEYPLTPALSPQAAPRGERVEKGWRGEAEPYPELGEGGAARSEIAVRGGDPVKTKRAREAARPVAPTMALTPQQALWLELMPFYIREAWLLDERRLKEWLDLFTDDVLYFMPRRKNVPRRESHRELTPLGDLAILEEDKRYLEMRVARLDTGMAWAEDPPSRTRHLIGNLEAAPLDNGEVEAKTAFLVYRSHLETDHQLLSGCREDLLRKVNGAWKVRRRTIVLDANVLLDKNLSVFL
jgi:3-phenylpropionate/cinnamic acid dioxygenase small subunit